MESDGVSGELEDYVLLTPADLEPPLAANPALRIQRVWYSFNQFDATLKFGGIAPMPVWVLARASNTEFDFTRFGGISDYNTVPPADKNGQLLISTTGYGPLGAQGSLVFEFRKP
jgi:hypothetical protein